MKIRSIEPAVNMGYHQCNVMLGWSICWTGMVHHRIFGYYLQGHVVLYFVFIKIETLDWLVVFI